VSQRSDAQDLIRWVIAESGRQTATMETRPFNAQDVSMVAFDTFALIAALAKAVETLLDECDCPAPDLGMTTW
jgi:hypothetical protein